MSRLIVLTPRDPHTGEDSTSVGINTADVSGFIKVETPIVLKDTAGAVIKGGDGAPAMIVFTRMTYRHGIAGNPIHVGETPEQIAALSGGGAATPLTGGAPAAKPSK